jgi:hypothetical protein
MAGTETDDPMWAEKAEFLSQFGALGIANSGRAGTLRSKTYHVRTIMGHRLSGLDWLDPATWAVTLREHRLPFF